MFLPRSFDFNMEALAARLHVGSSNDSVMGRACALYEENRAFFDQGLAAAVPVEAVFDGTSLRRPSFDVPLPEALAAGLSVGPWKMFLFACTAGDMLCRRIEKESRPAAQYLLEVLSPPLCGANRTGSGQRNGEGIRTALLPAALPRLFARMGYRRAEKSFCTAARGNTEPIAPFPFRLWFSSAPVQLVGVGASRCAIHTKLCLLRPSGLPYAAGGAGGRMTRVLSGGQRWKEFAQLHVSQSFAANPEFKKSSLLQRVQKKPPWLVQRGFFFF